MLCIFADNGDGSFPESNSQVLRQMCAVRRKPVAIRQEKQLAHVLVDAHVHVHGCFDLARFFDAAAENFSEAAQCAGLPWPGDAALLMTESAGADVFSRLRAFAQSDGGSSTETTSKWRMKTTLEPASLLARNDLGDRIFVIAGRQIVTADGLEVLALATDRRFNDGRPSRTTLSEVIDAGAIPVLPWGFGKWLGRRGRLLAGLLNEVDTTPFLLGDTSHRLRILPCPDEFRIADENAVKILPGTDPLPFPSQVSRPGSYGFRIQGTLSAQTPAADFKKLLTHGEVIPYGRGEGLLRFGINQVAMQIRNRLTKPPARSRPGSP